MGADEIVMHPCGNLGPVDPQIQVKRQVDGKQSEIVSFGSEDLSGFLSFVRESVGLSDQEHLKCAFELFCKEVGAIPIGVSSRGSRLSISLGVKLLQMHMKDEAAKQKATAIAETLNKEFFHHGYPVGRKEAKEIGLKVVEPDAELEKKMWALWLDIEDELECRHPFNPMNEIEKSGNAGPLFAPVQHVQIPANIPPQMAQKVYQQLLQQIQLLQVSPVEYNTIAAVVESKRVASLFRTKGKIFARRDFEAKISLNTVVTSAQWEPISIPKPPSIQKTKRPKPRRPKQ